MKLQRILVIALIFLASSKLFSQEEVNQDSHILFINVQAYSFLEIQSSSTKHISLNVKAPKKAGKSVKVNQSNNDLWLNYSALVGENSQLNISVQIIDGNVPEGIDLTVEAKSYKGDGKGILGKPVSKPVLLNSKKAIKLIEGIGSSYTGNGVNKGYNLIYRISQSKDADSYAKINSKHSNTLTISYTLADE